MIALPVEGKQKTAVVLSGALVELTLLPPPATLREALTRIQAIFLCAGTPRQRLELIVDIGLAGLEVEAEPTEPKPDLTNVVTLHGPTP